MLWASLSFWCRWLSQMSRNDWEREVLSCFPGKRIHYKNILGILVYRHNSLWDVAFWCHLRPSRQPCTSQRPGQNGKLDKKNGIWRDTSNNLGSKRWVYTWWIMEIDWFLTIRPSLLDVSCLFSVHQFIRHPWSDDLSFLLKLSIHLLVS